MQNFRKYVRHILVEKEKTMKDLADEMGVSQQLLNSYLSGKVKANTYKDRVISALNKL